MTTALQKSDSNQVMVPADVSAGALEVALAGDLSKLSSEERLKFYGALCGYTGLNPLSKPFDWIVFQGKMTLYANKGCAEQLRKIHKVNVEIIERRHEFGVYSVRIKANDGDGRSDESLAALPLPDNAPADARAMAMMKCETKAKRRVTFSICGLSLLVKRDDDLDAPKTANVISDTTTAGDSARSLNAEIVDVKDERQTALDDIQAALMVALPGTDSESKRAKSDLLQSALGVRSWQVVESLPVEKLVDGLAKLKEQLANPTPEPVVVAPVEPSKPAHKLVLKPEPRVRASEMPAAGKPAEDGPPFDEPEPPQSNLLDAATVAKLEAALGNNKTDSLNWLVKKSWITDEQGFAHLSKENADRILNNVPGFIKAVTPVKR